MADITTQSLLDPNAAELQGLNRQQAYAQALMAQGMNQPQGQIVSGRYVAPSFAQYLNPLAQTLTGAYLGNKAEEKQLQLANALRGKQTEAVQQYMDMLNPKQTELTGPTPTGAPLQTVNQANPQAAYMQAATNPYAPQALQQVALKKLTEGPKWEKATEYNKSKGVFETYVYDANSSTPETTKRIVGIEKPEMSKAEQINTGLALARARDEGIPGYGGIPSQPQQNAPLRTINPGSPILAPQGQIAPTNQPYNIPQINSPALANLPPAAQREVMKGIAGEEIKNQIANARTLPGAMEQMNSTLNTIDRMIGDTTINDKGELVKGKVEPHAGFESVVGSTWMPGQRFIPGTKAADFDTMLDQVKGASFMEAYRTLKGGGQITEVEGEKATQALNRMQRSQSEEEFVRAAREFQTHLRKGMADAQRQAGVAPTTPTLRWNPQTQSFQ
jgi:hypothetical protein